MGLTYVTAELTSFAGTDTPFSALFLVDTGAIDCLAPSDKLIEAGIKAESHQMYEMADGTLESLPVGYCFVSFMGSRVPVTVVFCEPGTEPLLGVVALEQAGYGVDPVNKQLMKLRALPLK